MVSISVSIILIGVIVIALIFALSNGLHDASSVVAALIISPLLGFIIAFILQKAAGLLLRNAKFTLNNGLKKIQWGIAGALAFSHGANDTQKIIGIITVALIAANGSAMDTTPLWVDASVNLEHTVDIFHRIVVRRI